MALMDALGRTVRAMGDAARASVGLAWDLARADFGDEDERTEALARLSGFAYNSIPIEGGRFLYQNPLEALAAPYRELVAQPLGTLSNMRARAVVERDPGVFFRGEEWEEAYQVAGENSLAQTAFGETTAIGLSLIPQSILPESLDEEGIREIIENPREAVKPRVPGYNVFTGTADALTNFFLDPFIVAGKGVKAMRVATAIRPLRPGEDLTKYLKSTPFSKWRQWTKGKTASEILRHPALKENPDAPLIATLLEQANKQGNDEAFDLIHRITWQGDPMARRTLDERHAEISATLKSVMEDHRNYKNLQAIERREITDDGLPHPLFQSDDLIEAKDKEYIALLKDDEQFHRRILGLTEGTSSPRPVGLSDTIGFQNWMANRRIGWQNMKRREGLFPDSVNEVFQPNFYVTPLVRVGQSFTDRHPNGWLNPNRADSWQEVEATLSRVRGLAPQKRRAMLDSYIRAANTTERMHAVENIERSTFNHIARQLGFQPKTAKLIMDDYFKGRALAMQQFKNRSYSAAKRNGRRVDVQDIDGKMVRAPVLDTQDPNFLPLLNVDEIYKNLRKHRDKAGMLERAVAAGETGVHGVQTVLDWINIGWKFSVLMRLGYTARTLWDDESRFLAKVGAMSAMTQYGKGMRNLVRNRRVSPELQERIGDVGFEYKGYQIPGAFEGEAQSYRQLASSAQSFDSLLGAEERKILRDIRQHAQDWRNISPKERPDEHLDAWAHAINQQLSRSVVARKLMEGNPPDKVAKWLRNSKEGRSVRRKFPLQSGDVEDWVGRVQAMLYHYMPKHVFTREFYQKALDQNITVDDLKRLYPDTNSRPTVHGGVLGYNTGESPVADKVYGVIQKGYHFLNSLPTDVLIRNKAFDHFYREHITNLIAQADAAAKKTSTHVEKTDLDRYARQARQYALGQIRGLFYDITTKSSAAHSLRFMMPFFAAWQDSVQKWTRLSLEDPSNFFRMNMFLQGVAKPFTVVDEDGNEVEGEARANDYIRAQVPEWFANMIPGHQSLLQIPKNAFNVWFPGDPAFTPGFGPMVQIAVSEFTKHVPSSEDALKFFLPYGPSTAPGSLDLALPATGRRLVSLARGEEDPAFANSATRIMQTELARYQDGKREDKPTWNEVIDRTRKLYMLRTFANATLPVSVQFRPPTEYQFFIDEYHRLRREDPENADEAFYEKYGNEYYFFATSVSKSNTGLPATLEAVQASKKYADLIETAPELAGLIVGPEGAGDFSSAAYAWQLGTTTGPGSTERRRERQSPAEALIDSQRRAGWAQYRKYMTQLDAVLHSRGLSTYQVQGAQDLAQLKSLITERLGELYPEWEKDFRSVDLGAMKRRIEGMRKIANESSLLNDPRRGDIKTLNLYLQGRDMFAAELMRRTQAGGAKTLTAQSNRDLFVMWQAFQGMMVERDTQFGDLFHRYLSNDLLQGVA